MGVLHLPRPVGVTVTHADAFWQRAWEPPHPKDGLLVLAMGRSAQKAARLCVSLWGHRRSNCKVHEPKCGEQPVMCRGVYRTVCGVRMGRVRSMLWAYSRLREIAAGVVGGSPPPPRNSCMCAARLDSAGTMRFLINRPGERRPGGVSASRHRLQATGCCRRNKKRKKSYTETMGSSGANTGCQHIHHVAARSSTM